MYLDLEPRNTLFKSAVDLDTAQGPNCIPYLLLEAHYASVSAIVNHHPRPLQSLGLNTLHCSIEPILALRCFVSTLWMPQKGQCVLERCASSANVDMRKIQKYIKTLVCLRLLRFTFACLLCTQPSRDSDDFINCERLLEAAHGNHL